MDQIIRNKLRGAVIQCRKLLEDSTAQALESRFGIYMARKKGEIEIEDESSLTHLAEEDKDYRRELLVNLDHIRAIGYKSGEALEQLIREIAFTHLNRICAYKMMEVRGLIRESVSRGLKSQGFFFFLSDHPEDEKLHNSGGQETAYRHFLDWLGETLSQEIGVLFNPNDPANRIYPPQRILDEVMALVNDVELKDIWAQDETIGWVYQYFTPKELRDKAHKESQAPRNSYELAFRNQFFTPRYVVEFLSDNTLGRIWYEMQKGETVLKDRCQYLIRRPHEIFLKEGEELPESQDVYENLSHEEEVKHPVYILHRPKKDPREIKVLDPACGSGHFLLYCFDLLQVIYEEAYDDPDLSAAFRKDYPAIEDLRRAVPGMILKHNLHGIDIDLRATQIAALALWLRCQRAFQVMGLKDENRRKMITRSHIVCAEPMPGETDLLKEFTSTLQPKVLGQLVEVIFEKMKLAGEEGSLLKIEEEIRVVAETAKKEYQEELRRQNKQYGYLPGFAPQRELSCFDFSDMTDSEFLDRVEEEIVVALHQYAEKSSNGKVYRKRLFSEDAERGFAFIDVCRKLFDVVLMNPPFGEFVTTMKGAAKEVFPNSYNDIFAAFTERWFNRLNKSGLLAAITSRTGFFLTSFSRWRKEFILKSVSFRCFADLGLGVMDDAMVEAAAYVIGKDYLQELFPCIRTLSDKNKADALLLAIRGACTDRMNERLFWSDLKQFSILAGAPFVYWVKKSILTGLARGSQISPDIIEVRQGLATADDFRFARAIWEVPPYLLWEANHPNRTWVPYIKGGSSQPFFAPITLVVNWRNNAEDLWSNRTSNGQIRSNIWMLKEAIANYFFKSGFSWTRRAVRFIPYIVPSGCIPSASRYMAYPVKGSEYTAMGVVASNLATAYLRFFGEMFLRPNYMVEVVKTLPWVSLPGSTLERIEQTVKTQVAIRRKRYQQEEPYQEFTMPVGLSDLKRSETPQHDHLSLLGTELDEEVGRAYGLGVSDLTDLNKDFKEAVNAQRSNVAAIDSEVDDIDEDVSSSGERPANIPQGLLSYYVGCTLGRWDIRFATGERQPPELSDPFAPLPICPPGMLQGPDGLPAKPEDVPLNYPISIDWDGILVDDSGHVDDIVLRVHGVLEVIWKDRAEVIEREACESLGVKELREYFRKPGNGGFWMDHVKRYSKSRRKAPVYWYLRSAKGNYGLWLYYHRLDKDIFFKALINYVEPKIRLEEDCLKSLRGRKEASGSSRRETKQIEKNIDRQEQLVSELRDFADKLRRLANLHIKPDLNDGVVLNIALLWELVPWKEAKQYWEELVDGKFEWSSIARQMWEKKLVKK